MVFAALEDDYLRQSYLHSSRYRYFASQCSNLVLKHCTKASWSRSHTDLIQNSLVSESENR